jgi:hypothetical protein
LMIDAVFIRIPVTKVSQKQGLWLRVSVRMDYFKINTFHG